MITGAGSGIGRATAICFAKEGADLVLADINLEAAKKRFDADQRKERERQSLLKRMCQIRPPFRNWLHLQSKTFQSVYAIVNNAAIQINKTAEDTSFEEWNRQLAVNLGGVFLCSKYFLPHLKISKGSIVNMSSVNGFFVEPTCAGYCATKAASSASPKRWPLITAMKEFG